MSAKRKTTIDLLRQVDDWNKAHEVGVKVIVKKDDGTEERTGTRSAAWVLNGHSAVIMLHRFSGCYLLDRVTPLVREEG